MMKSIIHGFFRNFRCIRSVFCYSVAFLGLCGVLFYSYTLFDNFLINCILPALFGVENLFDKKNSDGFVATVPYVYISIIGLGATIISIFVASSLTRTNQRKQDTIKILLDVTSSEEYEARVTDSKICFPPNKKASVQEFRKFLKMKEKSKERISAEAVEKLLNHYEFIATGIIKGNLDHTMLAETIRGRLCGLTYNMRDIISYRQSQNPRIFENLVNLYWLWVDPTLGDEYHDNGPMALEPTYRKSKLRKYLIMRFPCIF